MHETRGILSQKRRKYVVFGGIREREAEGRDDGGRKRGQQKGGEDKI